MRSEQRTQVKKTQFSYPDDFEQFWNAYPKHRRKGKKAAFTAWKTAKQTNLPSLDRVLEVLREQKTWPDWTKNNGQYVPLPKTWLNGGRWDDEKGNESTVRYGMGHETADERRRRKNMEAIEKTVAGVNNSSRPDENGWIHPEGENGQQGDSGKSTSGFVGDLSRIWD